MLSEVNIMKFKILLFVLISVFAFSVVSAQDLVASAPPTKGYMLRPGDEIEGKVLLESQFDFKAIVNEDGMIAVPFAQKPVVAKCRTDEQLRAELAELLGKYLRSPQLSLIVAKKNIPPATVYGEVHRPERFELHRRATLAELLAFAGGPKEEAGGTVQISRTQAPLCPHNGEDSSWMAAGNDPTEAPSRIYTLAALKLGTPESNPVIYPGDLIFVHRASPVYITGQVLAPQGIYIKEGGLSLAEAIAKVSGLTREAKTKDIRVYRLKPNSTERETISANYDLIRDNKQKDIMLQPKDIVEVGRTKDPMGLSILKFLVGAGKTAATSGMTNLGYRVVY